MSKTLRNPEVSITVKIATSCSDGGKCMGMDMSRTLGTALIIIGMGLESDIEKDMDLDSGKDLGHGHANGLPHLHLNEGSIFDSGIGMDMESGMAEVTSKTSSRSMASEVTLMTSSKSSSRGTLVSTPDPKNSKRAWMMEMQEHQLYWTIELCGVVLAGLLGGPQALAPIACWTCELR